MADTAASPVPDEDEESLASFSTLFLALVTLFVYVLFLKPTAQNNQAHDNNNNNNNTNNANNRTRERQRQRGGRRVPPQQQQQAQQQPTRRRHQISENALEILAHCQSLPPHVSTSTKTKSIGGFEILSENGLVVFSSTTMAAHSKQLSKSDASLQQRKERAKILSRLFAATHKDFGKTLPAPPSKGSTFVIGISKEKHLLNATQRPSLLKAIRGLAAHYTVLVIVSLDPSAAAPTNSSTSYEPTQNLHSEAVKLLRGESDLSESDLPSHRVLLAGSGKGKVALVRQLSTNIGLTVDFESTVQDELERFGYDVAIVEDWTTILPST